MPLLPFSTGLPLPVPIKFGGTGSATQNFVDLSTAQTVGGAKTFTSNLAVNSAGSGTSDNTILNVYGANAGFRQQFAVINSATASTSNKASFQLAVNSSTGQRTAFQFDASFNTTTDASRNSLVTLQGASGGTFQSFMQFNGVNAQFFGNVSPGANGTLTNGTPSLYWSNLYSTTLNLNSTASLSGGTAGQIKATGVIAADHGLTVNGGPINWSAKDQGLLAWTFDLAMTSNNNNKPSATGAVNFCRMYVPTATSVTNILMTILTAGATLTAGQNFAALYDQNGNLIGTTADQSTAWQSTGLMTMALAGGPFTVGPGYIYVGFWVNGTTAPGFLRTAASTGAEINVGLTSTTYRFGSGGVATTTAPATVGTLSAAGVGYWVGLS